MRDSDNIRRPTFANAPIDFQQAIPQIPRREYPIPANGNNLLEAELARLKHGDHICAFYDNVRHDTVLISFIKKGLEAGDRCICVLDDRNVDKICAELEQAGVNVNDARNRGALGFIGKSEWRNPGNFDIATMAEGVKKIVNRSLMPSWKGLWIAVEMTWTLTPDIDAALLGEWESFWNKLIDSMPAVLLCQYNRSRISPAAIYYALKTHPFVITPDDMYRNFYYEPPDLFLNHSAHAERTSWMLQQFERVRALEEQCTEQLKEQIQRSINEKEIMLKEIHHRVKNNLQVVTSLLFLQSEQIEDPKTRSLFKESKNRVRSMALIHEKLCASDDFGNIDLAAFIHDLVSELTSSYSTDPNQISIRIDARMLRLPLNTAITWALVVHELVSNSLKYAFPKGRTGMIEISLQSKIPGRAVLTVRDDGVGLPKELDPVNVKSLGLRLVNLLAKQLDAEVEVERVKGTTFKLSFSIPS